MKMRFDVLVLFPLILLPLSLRASAEECGMEAKVGGISDIIPKETFEKMLSQKDDPRCHAVGFYTYDAFIAAAKVFPKFGNTGNTTTRKREIAAFFGQTSHETTGGWPGSDPPRDHWGYCYVEQIDKQVCCQRSEQYDCCPQKPGLKFYGRGPIQITWNYNYGLCGKDLWNDVNYLQCNPDLVAQNATVSFLTAIWFWMTPQYNKPSSHDVITDIWKPTPIDIQANRYPGYGVITNIINGGVECGNGKNDAGEDRIGFYKRYCDMFEIGYGDEKTLDCYKQRPFGSGSLKMVVDTI